MPSHYKLRGIREKYILRRAAAHLLPPEILNRRKQGLGTPLIPWFRGGMYDVARDLLSDANLRSHGYFEPRAVDKLFHSSRDTILHRDDLGKLFKLILFEVWLRIFIDRPVGPFESLGPVMEDGARGGAQAGATSARPGRQEGPEGTGSQSAGSELEMEPWSSTFRRVHPWPAPAASVRIASI